MTKPFDIELLASHHNRADFDCGVSSLNDYLRRFAGQNARRSVGRTYVAVAPGDARVWGYYTLSSGAVMVEAVSQDERAGLPRLLPMVHLGRLAVDHAVQGQRLGETLLHDALLRAYDVAEQIGVYSVEVWALSEDVRRFYERFGFKPLLDDPLHLHLPMKTIRKLIR